MASEEILLTQADRCELDHYFEMVLRVTRQLEVPHDASYRSLEQFVRMNGKRFYRRVSHPVGTARQCYKNATWLAIENRKLTYCEGYALNLLPVLHAWCVDETGAVIDPTWKEGRAYCGVPFKTSFVQQQMKVTKTYGLLEWPGMTYILKAKESEWKA